MIDLIRQPALWIITPLYKVWAAPFYCKGIPLTQSHFDKHSLRSSSTFFIDTESNPRPPNPDPGGLLLILINPICEKGHKFEITQIFITNRLPFQYKKKLQL